MIDVVDCTHHYGVRPVLRDVNLHVHRGELIALMGPNSMGKSTLLAVMAGILAPARGYVVIDGKRRRNSVDEERAARQMCAYLPAEIAIPNLVTPRRWLIAIGRLYGQEDLHIIDHAQRLIELFDLSSVADTAVISLSSGQKKKVWLAGALVSEAPVMLLDEPFSGGLDPGGIHALKRVLQQLTDAKKTTVVMATPVPELVEELAERVAIIQDGRLLAVDTIDNLRARAGDAADLGEIYAKLVHPENQGQVERYLAGETRR